MTLVKEMISALAAFRSTDKPSGLGLSEYDLETLAKNLVEKASDLILGPVNVTDEMVSAGALEASDHRLGSDMRDVVRMVYVVMEVERRLSS